MRLIVIGDVHGCLSELEDLLARLAPGDDDRVACVGDFLTKGPRPLECLQLWRDRGWLAVLGNNDYAVIRSIRGETVDPKDMIEKDARRLDGRPDLVEYVESLPRVIDLPDLDCAVVHGGVLPHSSFDDGVDPTGLLTLRMVVQEEDRWRAAHEGDPNDLQRFWADVWDGDRLVVYGHTPRPDVVRHRRAIGVDTGCVYGWRLTAAVRTEDPAWTTVSVPARKAWAER